MGFDLSWDQQNGMQTHHASAAIVLTALLFLILVRHGFRPVA